MSSGEISGTRKAARNALQICWRSPLQIALTAGCCASWWKLNARMENRTLSVAYQTYWLVFITTAKNDCPNFVNRKDPTFKELTGTLEVTCREFHRERVRANVKHAAIFSPAEENALWDLRVSSDHAPVTLQRAVFFYVGKVFRLRGGQEQRDFKISKFVRSTDPGYT